MQKIGFVIPWFGENIPGGAEMELREVTAHLQQAGMEVEILTTCVKEFTADWNENYYAAGTAVVGNITVRRFPVRRRDTAAFDRVNRKLMDGKQISPKEEQIFVEEMVNSPQLYEYMRDTADEYGLFVFIPYMFGTTYYGMQVCPEKSVLIPCFHRGYAVARNEQGQILRAAQEAAAGEKIEVLLGQGSLNCTVNACNMGGNDDGKNV